MSVPTTFAVSVRPSVKSTLDCVGAVDHVVVGQDVAVAGDDDARAERRAAAAAAPAPPRFGAGSPKNWPKKSRPAPANCVSRGTCPSSGVNRDDGRRDHVDHVGVRIAPAGNGVRDRVPPPDVAASWPASRRRRGFRRATARSRPRRPSACGAAAATHARAARGVRRKRLFMVCSPLFRRSLSAGQVPRLYLIEDSRQSLSRSIPVRLGRRHPYPDAVRGIQTRTVTVSSLQTATRGRRGRSQLRADVRQSCGGGSRPIAAMWRRERQRIAGLVSRVASGDPQSLHTTAACAAGPRPVRSLRRLTPAPELASQRAQRLPAPRSARDVNPPHRHHAITGDERRISMSRA